MLCSVRVHDICVGLSMRCVIADNSRPLILYKRFVLNNKRLDFTSVLFEPNPNTILAGDHLDIGFLNH